MDSANNGGVPIARVIERLQALPNSPRPDIERRGRERPIEVGGLRDAGPLDAARIHAHLQAAAEAAHAARLARLEALAADIAGIEGRSDTSRVMREITRILAEENVDAALAYLATQRDAVLRRVQARAAATREQNRVELEPLLAAAGLEAARGSTAAARAAYEEILALDPAWPAALADYGWFLYDQSIQQMTHGSLATAVEDATRLLELAERLPTQPGLPEVQARLLPAALKQMADELVLRGQPGDWEQALAHYQRSLALRERLLAANPESASLARDVTVSHFKLWQVGEMTGRETLANRHRPACHALLHKYISAGVTFDQPLMDLYRQLRAEFGGGQCGPEARQHTSPGQRPG